VRASTAQYRSFSRDCDRHRLRKGQPTPPNQDENVQSASTIRPPRFSRSTNSPSHDSVTTRVQLLRYCSLPTLLLSSLLLAQSPSNYNPHQAFDPGFLSESGTTYRSGSGAPGPGYWQNRADYRIAATLDTAANLLSAHEVITYTNRSPDVLPYVWLQLDQNIMRKDSREALTQPGRGQFFGAAESTEGFELKSIHVTRRGKRSIPTYTVSDTRLQIILPSSLTAHGDRIDIEIDYSFSIPRQGAGRMGRGATQYGTIYDIAQWYPRMAVYDDVRGWNNLPYLGSGEFYLDYGDFDCALDVPGNQVVVASGELVNPKEVLTREQRRRLDQARRSDETISIRTPEGVKSGAETGDRTPRKTWHFVMKNTRDFSWAASSAFVWDAARIRLPSGKPCLAMSVYPVESVGDSAYNRSAEYVKNSVEIFSKDWFEYPYPAATTVGGPVGGEEYPGIVFCSWAAKGKDLWWITAHEIGHNWFPMVVGSDERRYAFMDEGFNTFIDIYASEQFNHGEYAPKRDGEYAPRGGNPAREIVPLLLDPEAPPILTAADAIPGQYVHPVEYYKCALGLVLLRTDILGPERFDRAFREYIKEWAFKHPIPDDFFRAMNSSSGENLNWFWKGWFVQTWTVDQRVKDVKYVGDDPANGALITLENDGEMPMPVTVKIKESNQHIGRVSLPVEVWERAGEWTFQYPSTSMIDSVVVDPDEHLPDVDPANNVWTSGVTTARPRRHQ
jgi:hypothetical protein